MKNVKSFLVAMLFAALMIPTVSAFCDEDAKAAALKGASTVQTAAVDSSAAEVARGHCKYKAEKTAAKASATQPIMKASTVEAAGKSCCKRGMEKTAAKAEEEAEDKTTT